MVMEKLSTSLKETLGKIARAIFVDEKLIDALIKDIQRSLLSADVNVQLVFDLSKKLKERMLNEKPPKGISQKEFLIKIVYEELVNLMGKEEHGIKIEKKKPFKIMMVGLLGNGKTTSIGKIAKYYSKRGYKIATIGLDVHRPAAMDQIEQVSKQVNVKCFLDKNEKNPIKIYKKFKDEYKEYDILIIDTAGRHAIDTELIKELKNLNNEIKADENLLVMSADVGQAAFEQASEFHKNCNITGVMVTKLDGTGKAGGSLAATAATKAPIKFIGAGERLDDLELFNPEGFVSRLLGMGDLKALLEKAEEAISKEDAEDLGKRFLAGEFNFIDLYEQMQTMKKMGPLSKVMELIPGMGNLSIPKEMLEVQEDKLKKWRYILDSMTKEELEDPEIVTSRSRIERLAKGSGTTTKEVRELLKQYKQTKKMSKLMKGLDKEKDINKLMKKFKGKMPKGFKT